MRTLKAQQALLPVLVVQLSLGFLLQFVQTKIRMGL